MQRFSSTNWFVLRSFPCSDRAFPCAEAEGAEGGGRGPGGTPRTAAWERGSTRGASGGRMACGLCRGPERTAGVSALFFAAGVCWRAPSLAAAVGTPEPASVASAPS